jgi:hypothetical protein
VNRAPRSNHLTDPSPPLSIGYWSSAYVVPSSRRATMG